MKKYLIFSGGFILAFMILQIFSGMLLTMVYTPSILEGASTLASQVEFGNTSFIPPLVIALLALGIAFGATKLFNKKIVG